MANKNARAKASSGRQWLMVLGLLVAVIVVVVAVVLSIYLFTDHSVVRMDKDNQIAVGADHMVAVNPGGMVFTWGHNHYGELGNITTANTSKPVAITSKIGSSGVAQVAAGDEITFAVKKNGDLYAWGNNTSYQMGDGMNVSRMEPEKVMEDVVTVAAGGSHAMAIKKDGALYVWGCNSHGQLGLPQDQCDQTNEDGQPCLSQPTKLMDNVAAISCGQDFSAAVTTNGELYVWGYDDFGQLGLGGKTDAKDADGYGYQTTPVKVLDGVADVACGFRQHILALTTDGDVYAWGSNKAGSVGLSQVDDTKNECQTVPAKLMSGIQQIAAGSAHSAALTTDGELYVWGLNTYGQMTFNKGNVLNMGEEDIYYQPTPKQVKKDIASIYCGGNATAYVTNGGILYTCGSNLYGELGVGQENKDQIVTPTAVTLKE